MNPRRLSSLEEWSVARRFLSEVWCEVDAAQWRRRAAQLEAARPRRGDFPGQATPVQLVEQYERLTDAAEACRNRAQWLEESRRSFDDTLGTFTDAGLVEDLEDQLRAALDAGDQPAIDRLTAAIDRLTIPTGAAS